MSLEDQLHIEEERLRLERDKFALERSFSRKYGNVLITGAISLVAVLVSITQVRIAQLQHDQQLQMQEAEQARRWSLDVSDFVLRNHEAVFSSDAGARERIRSIMVASGFPKEILEVTFERLATAGPPENADTWHQAREMLRAETVDIAGYRLLLMEMLHDLRRCRQDAMYLYTYRRQIETIDHSNSLVRTQNWLRHNRIKLGTISPDLHATLTLPLEQAREELTSIVDGL